MCCNCFDVVIAIFNMSRNYSNIVVAFIVLFAIGYAYAGDYSILFHLFVFVLLHVHFYGAKRRAIVFVSNLRFFG